MRLDLDDNYAIEYDGLCFQLLSKRIVKAREEGSRGKVPKPENIGKMVTSVEGYYGTLPQALRGYLNKDIGKSERETFEAVMDYLDAVFNRLDTVFDQVDPAIRAAYKKATTPEEHPSVQQA